MSRGFVKEDDQEEAPFVPPRAALPDGVPNHVTPRGLELLLEERATLEAQRAAVAGNEQERRRTQAEIDGRMALLNERIASARVMDPAATKAGMVQFGRTVTYHHQAGRLAGQQFTFTIVGVDEADVKQRRIAFTSPLARALIGKRKGGVAVLRTNEGEQRLKVLSIS